MEVTDKTVEEGLNAIAQMVFPFRALETQKQWICQGKHGQQRTPHLMAHREVTLDKIPALPQGAAGSAVGEDKE
jgi:hypothetical protein